jgi:Arc/MetJ family transcription regulator
VRTTISISDELLAAAKQRARERGQTLGEVVDAALQRELSEPEERHEAPAVPVFRGGTGARPGIDLTSNRALHEALDEAIELHDRR